jgi:hypothetical protein
MKHFFGQGKRATLAFSLLVVFLFTFGCAMLKPSGVNENMPPVLAQDELLRPYHKVAAIEVSRERYGSVSDITPEDYSWAYQSLREEASRIGADAVILPEIRVVLESYIFFPSSEIRAKGIAIKFD